MPSRIPLRCMLATSQLHNLPLNRLAAAIDQLALFRALDLPLVWRGPGPLLERDAFLVRRQLVVLWPIERGEGLKLVQRPFLFEHLGVGLDRDRGVEDARDAVQRELAYNGMRRGVGAE